MGLFSMVCHSPRMNRRLYGSCSPLCGPAYPSLRVLELEARTGANDRAFIVDAVPDTQLRPRTFGTLSVATATP